MLAMYLISSGNRQVIALLDIVDGQKSLIKRLQDDMSIKGLHGHSAFSLCCRPEFDCSAKHKGGNKNLRFVSSSLHGAGLNLTKIHAKMLTSNPVCQPRL